MQWFGLARRLFVAGHLVDNPHGELSVVPVPKSKDLVLEGELLTLNELTFVSTPTLLFTRTLSHTFPLAPHRTPRRTLTLVRTLSISVSASLLHSLSRVPSTTLHRCLSVSFVLSVPSSTNLPVTPTVPSSGTLSLPISEDALCQPPTITEDQSVSHGLSLSLLLQAPPRSPG